MKCAEVNCHEAASTVAQVELDGARYALPACAMHDVGDISVEAISRGDTMGMEHSLSVTTMNTLDAFSAGTTGPRRPDLRLLRP